MDHPARDSCSVWACAPKAQLKTGHFFFFQLNNRLALSIGNLERCNPVRDTTHLSHILRSCSFQFLLLHPFQYLHAQHTKVIKACSRCLILLALLC